MKKIVLVILLSVFCFSAIVNAEVKFGGWDKWDESLPPWNSKDWIWAIDADSSVLGGEVPLAIFLKDDLILSASNLCYIGKDKTKASVLFYSLSETQGEILINKYKIPRPNWVIVAFPPDKKNHMIVMAYKAEDQIFKFFEKWEISFENYQLVVPKEAEFRKTFKIWLKETTVGDITDEITDCLLPKLLIDKKNFIILIGTIQEIKKIDGLIKIRTK